MSWNKLTGLHTQVALSIDHGPLFDRDEMLGFTVVPGTYRIRERLDHSSHDFSMTVVSRGRRATTYRSSSASKRMFILGDSFIFGWGLYDEQTVPWLLQVRLPDFDVVNLSLNSYSAVQAILLLERVTPALNSSDVVVVMYHPLMNELTTMKQGVLDDLINGTEVQLGSPEVKNALMPFGVLDASGDIEIRRLRLDCKPDSGPQCDRPQFQPEAAARVTERAFDKIMAIHPGRLVIGWLSGPDTDPVIEYLRGRGVGIADLRHQEGYQWDEMPDSHPGPFAAEYIYEKLQNALAELALIH